MENSDKELSKVQEEALLVKEKATNIWRVLRSQNNYEKFVELYDQAQKDAINELGSECNREDPNSVISHANFMLARGNELVNLKLFD